MARHRMQHAKFEAMAAWVMLRRPFMEELPFALEPPASEPDDLPSTGQVRPRLNQLFYQLLGRLVEPLEQLLHQLLHQVVELVDQLLN
jgi:hypothetical protein